MIRKTHALAAGSMSRALLLAGVATLLSACNADLSDLEQYVADVKSRPARAIEPIPVIKPYVRFVYPDLKADPFDVSILQPDKKEDPIDSVMVDKNRVPEYLEGFPLESLRMVGTVYKEEQLWALIQVPNGAVHRVRKGNYIGKNHGKITSVKEVSIGLSEIVENGMGGHKARDNMLAISNPNK